MLLIQIESKKSNSEAIKTGDEHSMFITVNQSNTTAGSSMNDALLRKNFGR
jgi:hypothetical protein